MFFGRKHSLLHVLLLILGIKYLKRERWSDEDKADYRAKRRAFRHKIREAFDVWDEPTQSSDPSDKPLPTEN